MSAAEQVTIRVSCDDIQSRYFIHPHPAKRGKISDTLFRDEAPVKAIIKQHTKIHTGCIDWLQVGHFVAESLGYENVTFTNVEYDICIFDKQDKEKAQCKDDVHIIVDHRDHIRIQNLAAIRFEYGGWMNRNGSDIARYIRLRTDRYTGCIDWVEVCNDILRSEGCLKCKCVGVIYIYEELFAFLRARFNQKITNDIIVQLKLTDIQSLLNLTGDDINQCEKLFLWVRETLTKMVSMEMVQKRLNRYNAISNQYLV